MPQIVFSKNVMPKPPLQLEPSVCAPLTLANSQRLEGKKVREKSKTGGKKGKRKVQGVPQSQTAALPRPQEEEETDKSKQAQTEQTYEKH